MNRFLFASRAIALCFAIAIGSILGGCSSLNAGSAGEGLSTSSTNSPQSSSSDVFNDGGFRIRKGDKLKFEFFEAPNMPPWEQVVREDGTIVLPMSLVITAERKTKRELADEIHKVYVPKYFKRLTVN